MDFLSSLGIYRIRLPTPFLVGRVNVYLIKDSCLTLIDTGPNSEKSLVELKSKLGKLDLKLSDIRRLLITHPHADHFGLARKIVDESGAEVWALEKCRSEMENFYSEYQKYGIFFLDLFVKAGVPDQALADIKRNSEYMVQFIEPVKMDRPLKDGEIIPFDNFSLKVLHLPGHSPFCTCYYDTEGRFMLSGDHLIKHISSNPIIQKRDEKTGERPSALATYLESFKKTRKLKIDLILPGHGSPIKNHKKLIDQRFKLHQDRMDEILGILEKGPLTPYGIGDVLFPGSMKDHEFLILSEVIGHLDLLKKEGKVTCTEKDNRWYYSAV